MSINEIIVPKARTLIETRMASVASEHQVKIFYACESGSRAWGFPSPDSDYDVRFVYVHPWNWYLTLEEYRDVIDLPLEESSAGLLDLGGWDLRKTLRLCCVNQIPSYGNGFNHPFATKLNRLSTFENYVVYSILFIRRLRHAIIICLYVAIP